MVLIKAKNTYYLKYPQFYACNNVNFWDPSWFLEGKEKATIELKYEDVTFYSQIGNDTDLNRHHCTLKSNYESILPKINERMQFGFSPDDFYKIAYQVDGKENAYFMLPKNDKHFTVDLPDEKYDGGFLSLIAIHRGGGEFTTNYHRLFIGAHRCCRILNKGENNSKKLLVSGDSMMIPLIPIMAYYYKEVVFLDNRGGYSFRDYFKGRTFDDAVYEFFFNCVDKIMFGNFK